MNLPLLQAHVLANLDRVEPLVGIHRSGSRRYQLDGKECTYQITGLCVRKYVRKCADGTLSRLQIMSDGLAANRQKPSAQTIEMIRASMATPAIVRNIRSRERRGTTFLPLVSPASAAPPEIADYRKRI